MGKSKNKNTLGDTQSQTPQPQKKQFGKLGNKPKTPKSAPPAKSKKISEEISDDEFEQLIKDVRKEELIKEKLGKRTPKPKSPKKGGSEEDEDDDESSDEDFDLGDVTFGDDDNDDDSGDDDSDEDEDDDDEDEDDDDSEDDDDDDEDGDEGKVNGVNKDMAKKLKALINSNDGFDSDDDSDEDEDDDDEDDDEEDDDDDDSDEMEAEAPPTKKAKKQKVQQKMEAEDSDDDDEEDDDEDEEEDEDDSDDDSDEDEKPPAKKAKRDSKAEKALEKADTKSKKRKAEDSGDKPSPSKISKDDLIKDQKTTEELNSRTLMIKELTESTKQDDLRDLLPKPLQSKLTDVRISSHHRRKKSKGAKKIVTAYLEFNNEQQAEKAYEKLKQAKLDSKPVVVDYVGAKSVNKPEHKGMTTDPEDYDPLRLFIGSLDRKVTTEEEIRKHFPSATKIQVPKIRGSNKLTGYAFAHYSSEAACKKAHDEKQNLILADKKVRVLFAKKTTEAKKADNRPQMLEAKALAKKVQAEKKLEKKDKSKPKQKEEKGKKGKKSKKVPEPEPSDSDDSDDSD